MERPQGAEPDLPAGSPPAGYYMLAPDDGGVPPPASRSASPASVPEMALAAALDASSSSSARGADSCSEDDDSDGWEPLTEETATHQEVLSSELDKSLANQELSMQEAQRQAEDLVAALRATLPPEDHILAEPLDVENDGSGGGSNFDIPPGQSERIMRAMKGISLGGYRPPWAAVDDAALTRGVKLLAERHRRGGVGAAR